MTERLNDDEKQFYMRVGEIAEGIRSLRDELVQQREEGRRERGELFEKIDTLEKNHDVEVNRLYDSRASKDDLETIHKRIDSLEGRTVKIAGYVASAIAATYFALKLIDHVIHSVSGG